MDGVDQANGVEVEDETDGSIKRAQGGEDLGEMAGQELVDGPLRSATERTAGAS